MEVTGTLYLQTISSRSVPYSSRSMRFRRALPAEMTLSGFCGNNGKIDVRLSVTVLDEPESLLADEFEFAIWSKPKPFLGEGI